MNINLAVPKFIKNLLNVIFWLSIILFGVYCVIILYTLFIGEQDAAKFMAIVHSAFPVGIDFINSDLTKNINSSLIFTKKLNALVTLKNPSTFFTIYSFAVYLFYFAATIIVFGLLRKIFSNISEERIFDIKNSMLITYLGILLTISPIIKTVLEIIGSNYIVDNINVDEINLLVYSHLNMFEVLVGLIVVALAQVFKFGTILKNEQDLTI